ncbi:hypothetical protein [Variovorax sp. YR216]|uniref:hypothetical protein n=1 Tax=Variovorax sp. YR216 TaxID=1882828 RepID=UPI00115FF766|nr:hypothetical protein [Variovorax sp. YR216]
MKSGETLSVWLSAEDRRRLEEACAIAGYQHLSRYVRDKALGKDGDAQRNRSDEWQHRRDVDQRLTELERKQAGTNAMLAALLVLARRRATTGELSELVAATRRSDSSASVLSSLAPELADVVARLSKSGDPGGPL